MKHLRPQLVALGAAFYFLVSQPAFPQGSLTPPGPPGPTMKSLDQIEARTPISSLPFVINKSGSYYLTRNLVTAGATAGITVSADNVTIDLNGFALVGGGGAASGILAPGAQKSLSVRNGTIRNWGNGAIQAGGSSSCIFERLRVLDSGGGANFVPGLVAGNASLVTDCIVTGGGGPGIVVNSNSTITRCVASGNFFEGIICGDNSTVLQCTASNNSNTGMRVGSYGTVSQCTASGNQGDGIIVGAGCTLSDSAAGGNGPYGFTADFGSTIRNCTARGNADGFLVKGGCHLIGNTADLNRDIGFQVNGGSNRVEGNNATFNTGDGFSSTQVNQHNLFIRNAANGNGGISYHIVSGNSFGTIVNLTAGGQGSSTDSLANIIY